MTTAYIIIIGVALGLLLGIFVYFYRSRYRDVFGGLLIIGIIGLAVAVTIYRVDQYRTEKQAATTQPATERGSGPSSQPAGSRPRPFVGIPMRPPMGGGPSGAAAPAAVPNPYSGNP